MHYIVTVVCQTVTASCKERAGQNFILNNLHYARMVVDHYVPSVMKGCRLINVPTGCGRGRVVRLVGSKLNFLIKVDYYMHFI